MMKRTLVAFFAFLCLWTLSCQAEGVHWQTNYAAAKQEAESSGKPIVLLFTGSDWCHYCILLEKVIDTPEFANAAGSNFVFVKLDFPRQKQLDQATTQQNQELQRQFHINAYPSVIIVDAKGKQLGSTGYEQNMSPGQYAQHLKERAGLR
jgi:protein disulfide-isomerase